MSQLLLFSVAVARGWRCTLLQSAHARWRSVSWRPSPSSIAAMHTAPRRDSPLHATAALRMQLNHSLYP